MLNEKEISCYFEGLPKDLTLSFNDNVYHVNKESISILSGKINSLIKENQNKEFIEAVFPDPKSLFPLVVDFLQGKYIDITPRNVYYLRNLAQYFEVSSLENALQKELSAETNIDNVVQKIIHCNAAETDFLFENIDKVIYSEDIFDLPVSLLIDIVHNEKAKFSTDNMRYTFALRCCKVHPDNVNDLITEDIISKIPIETFSTLLSENYDFSAIEHAMPNTLFALRLISDLAKLQTDIDFMSHAIEDKKNSTKEIISENKGISKGIEKYQEISNNYKTELKGVSAKLSEINSEELVITSQTLSLKVFDESKLDKIGSVLNNYDKLWKELDFYVHKMQKVKLLYPGSMNDSLRITNRWNEILKELHGICAKLNKNDTEMIEFLETVKRIDLKLRQITTSYFEGI